MHSDIQELCRSSRIVTINSIAEVYRGEVGCKYRDFPSFNSLAAVLLTTVQHWRV